MRAAGLASPFRGFLPAPRAEEAPGRGFPSVSTSSRPRRKRLGQRKGRSSAQNPTFGLDGAKTASVPRKQSRKYERTTSVGNALHGVPGPGIAVSMPTHGTPRRAFPTLSRGVLEWRIPLFWFSGDDDRGHVVRANPLRCVREAGRGQVVGDFRESVGAAALGGREHVDGKHGA